MEETIAKAADKIMGAVQAYGPQATDLALATGRVAALNDLIQAGVTLGIGLLFFGASAALFMLGLRKKVVGGLYIHDAGFGFFIMGGFVAVVGAISFIVGATQLANAFAWVGLNHPEVYLAGKLLKL